MNNENTKDIVSIDNIRLKIKSEIPNIDKKPYSDAIISIQLEEARKYLGEFVKNSIIDELGLEKYGWNKDEGKIHRGDKYTDSNPLP